MRNKKGIIAINVVALAAVCVVAYIAFSSINQFEEPVKPIDKIELPINSDFDGGSIHCGYLYPMYNKKYIANTYEEFQKYCENNNNYAYDGYGNVLKDTGNLNPLIEKYTKEFFEEKSLALVYVELGSGSDRVEFTGTTKNGTTIQIHYRIIEPAGGIGTCDMSGYIVFAEIDKDIINII